MNYRTAKRLQRDGRIRQARILMIMRQLLLVAALGVALVTSAVAQGTETSGAGSPSDVLTKSFVTAWQQGDAASLANLWTEDGDWMSLIGSRGIQSGRDAIQGVWEIGLEGRDTPEKRRLDILVDSVLEYGDDLAQIDAVMVFGTPETGQIRESLTAILVRVEHDWRIASARVARIETNPAR